ncbi:carnitine O-palmitoyltransferase 1, liver isoform-like [Lingula anatina]|uniref:Carnitine O-palmitoyltransferase 1, liver isoform-like n=1 Tax=Lingula anatina TaxID=7574 RepID=A0A1S3IJQ7_LINAN|nr:carnitine O-palmitoyltransferase 1, liver isoform-like [Lingula anatina]|eukprot:XP_013398447.1 carnitine O-palmitoyltransferase 1, liver isoform-like [Lingula anatina]
MAEAHAAVAFSFTITHEGVNFDVNHDALHAVWESGVRSWKKRIARFKNRLINIMYPAAPISWVFTVSIVLAFVLAKVDVSLGLIDSIQSGMPGYHVLTLVGLVRNIGPKLTHLPEAMDLSRVAPILLNGTVPLCSQQYERQFNSVRLPGVETDKLVHWYDSRHIVVYHKGCYYKMYIHYKGRLLNPAELELSFKKIIEDNHEPAKGEEKLGALTAGDRIPWAKARKEYFGKGVNKTSLDSIEKSAFVVVLDDEPRYIDLNEPNKLSSWARAMLHGKGYDRWFDKTFNLIISANGRIGFNAEHSWADAPIMAHLWEYGISEDIAHLGYELPFNVHNFGGLYILTFKLVCVQDLWIWLHFVIFWDAGKFCLTYEASMTRLFREGRTETVRSCTIDAANFARAMDDKTKTKAEKMALFKKASETHQESYRLAMTGNGIDRHLFCLYVVSKYLEIESPFLKEVLGEPWRLSTSQTPHTQTDRLDLLKHPDHICAGGGFGPVADDGYGVSYIIAGEYTIFFHISCKRSCAETNAKRFGRTIVKALDDLKNLFEV